MKMIKKFTIVPNSKAYWEFINSRPPLTLHINYKKKIKVITQSELYSNIENWFLNETKIT